MRLVRAQKYFTSHQLAKGYSHVDTLNISDLKLQVTRLFHNQSGAMIYNVKSSDPQNTFSPVVRTLPQNDTGCPHILQHLACCGSNKFPIRDPFFNMLRRSVSTYMNAWTGDDFTAYPFSSVNRKDFNNLYKVYLDMCLNPLLNQLDFRQEGWRYQINSETKQKQLKGIVLNQMKGAYQSPDRQLYIEIAKKLFNQTPFGYDSGGKPDSIVKLSYGQVRSMHQYYYHPSNMSFFYYGSQCIKDKLSYLDSQYLQKYENKVDIYEAKTKKLLEKMPLKLSDKFGRIQSSTVQDPNVGVSYNIGMLNKFNEIDLTCLHILSYILLQTNQALFYQQFIESRLADSFGSSGFNVGSVLSFTLSLKNVSINQKQVLERMEKCLQRLVESGVSENRLEEYMRQTELDILTPKSNQGIQYLGNCIPYMNNRLPLNNLLNLKLNLNAAVQKLKQKEGLREIIHKYFIFNDKKVSILQTPTENKSEPMYSNLQGLQMPQEMILQQQQLLKQRQQSNSANSVQCLPKLSLGDLEDRNRKKFEIVKCGVNKNSYQVKQIHVPIDIKGIKFIKAVFTLQATNQQQEKLVKFLDLWRYAIKQGIAVKGLSSKELSSKLNLFSNQFQVSFQRPSAHEPNKIHIVFSAACLDKYVDEYLSLLRKIIWQPEFDLNNILNIFRTYKSEKMEELLDGKVMQYCLEYCGSFMTKSSQLYNSYSWVTQGIKIAESESIPKEFYQIHQILQQKSEVIFIEHSSQKKYSYLDKINISCQDKPRPSKITHQNQFKTNQVKIAVTNTYDVNFCTQQYLGPQRNTEQYAHIYLFLQLLEQDYLHPKIRQQGGAYGARAVLRDNGLIALYSYMDPKSTQTFVAFENSIKEILSSQITVQRLSQAKIKVIGALNLPIVPQRQCVKEILKDFKQENVKQLIQWVKNSSWIQICKTSSKYLSNSPKSRVVFGKDVPQGFTKQQLKMSKTQLETLK